ncbi:MAG: hypothetical protein WBP63_04570, partial [Silvibacterium sp.]
RMVRDELANGSTPRSDRITGWVIAGFDGLDNCNLAQHRRTPWEADFGHTCHWPLQVIRQ